MTLVKVPPVYAWCIYAAGVPKGLSETVDGKWDVGLAFHLPRVPQIAFSPFSVDRHNIFVVAQGLAYSTYFTQHGAINSGGQQ